MKKRTTLDTHLLVLHGTLVRHQHTWCGYKITVLMLEHFILKKLHNRNFVTLNVLPSLNPAPLHANLALLEAMLQVVF
jgi:hypothetical protein